MHLRAFWASELAVPFGFGLVLRKPEVRGGEEQRELGREEASGTEIREKRPSAH